MKRITDKQRLDWLFYNPAHDSAYHPVRGRICIVHPRSVPVYCNGGATRKQTFDAMDAAIRAGRKGK